MEKDQQTKQFLATREILSEILLISPHEVNVLWKHHGMPKESRGVYDLRKVIPFIIRRKNAQIEAQKHGDVTKTEADRQTAIFNMELLRIELAEKRKEVMNVNDMESLLTPTLITTAKKLGTLPKEINSTFPKDEAVEIRRAREEKIEKIVDECRTELAEIPIKAFGSKPKPAKQKRMKR